MEKILWDTFVAPGLRERLIQRYVPKEPIDPLIYKITAFYWLLQELVGNWKAGRRLTLEQKAQLLQILVWNISILQQEQAADISISQETTDQIANLVLACKEFQS